MRFTSQVKESRRISALIEVAVIGGVLAVVGVLTVGTTFAANSKTVTRMSNGGGLETISSVTTSAGQRRGRNWDGYPNLGGSYDLRQTALNAGYNEGSKQGR